MKKVLLVGNGINRIDNNYSWNNLMDDLLGFAGMKDAISVGDKPFPMLYEEIYLRWSAQYEGAMGNDAARAADWMEAKAENKVKKQIADLMEHIRSNDLHRLVMKSNVDEILTTNYDYNLESVTYGGVVAAKHVPPIKGNKYALIRRRKAGTKVVWHIHGEKNAPGSILLGYEQYAGYLQTIRNYMITGLEYKDLPLAPLARRIREGKEEILTWVDHFFFSDLYILGLNMDFVEMHLWWLLDFRARLLKDKRYTIRNKVTYIYPATETAWIKPRIDLLCACDVGCIALPVERNNWKAMYKMAIDMVNRAEVEVHP